MATSRNERFQDIPGILLWDIGEETSGMEPSPLTVLSFFLKFISPLCNCWSACITSERDNRGCAGQSETWCLEPWPSLSHSLTHSLCPGEVCRNQKGMTWGCSVLLFTNVHVVCTMNINLHGQVSVNIILCGLSLTKTKAIKKFVLLVRQGKARQVYLYSTFHTQW